MDHQTIDQINNERQQLLNTCKNLLRNSKSDHKISRKYNFPTSSIIQTQTQSWKNLILPQVNQKYKLIQKEKAYFKTATKIDSQSYLKNSAIQTNNPQTAESLYKSRRSAYNSQQKFMVNAKFPKSNKQLQYSLKLNEDSTQYDKNMIQQQNSEIQQFKQHILNENQKFLRRQVRQLEKLIRQKYEQKNFQQNIPSSQQFNLSKGNQYVQEQVRYLREKFLRHYQICQQFAHKIKK